MPFTCRCLCAVVAFPLFNASQHTYDGIHPNDDGERYIAGQWHTSLAYHLRTPPPPEEREVAGEHRELPNHPFDTTLPNHPLIKIRTGEAALPTLIRSLVPLANLTGLAVMIRLHLALPYRPALPGCLRAVAGKGASRDGPGALPKGRLALIRRIPLSDSERSDGRGTSRRDPSNRFRAR